LRWLADENFNNDILRPLRRGSPDIDIVRAQVAWRFRGKPRRCDPRGG
jgi:hypothetical protein